jgi:multidrug efflux pump subunit AcrB
VIPIIQYVLIKRGLHAPIVSPRTRRHPFLDIIQAAYEKLLAKTFAFPKTTLLIAFISIVAGAFMFLSTPVRMMPVAERDQFAVEIYLPNGSPLHKTAAIADSLENILRQDSRIRSVSAFIGTSSPRFHILYAPHSPSKSYAQFVVNTVSNRATEELLSEYTNKYAFYFPEAYVRFKQLDFQNSDAPLEVRLVSDNINEINYLAAELRGIRTKKVVDNEAFYILSHDLEILHMPVS